MQQLSRKSGKKSRAPVGASLVVLSSLIYASYGVWIRLMGDSFGSFVQVAIRAALVALLLLPFAVWRKELSKIHWRRDRWWIAGAGLSALLAQAPLYYAVLKIGVGLGAGISYAGIVLGAFFFGWVFGGERFTRDKWFSTALGILGLGLVFSPNIKSLGLLGMLAALLSGSASGFNMVVNKSIKYSASQTAIMTWLATVVFNVPFALLWHQHVPALTNVHWLYLVGFTLASLMASWALISGLKLIEAGAAGILGLLEIVFGLLLGAILFGEHPYSLAIVGMISIIAAASVPYLQHYNSQRGTIDEV